MELFLLVAGSHFLALLLPGADFFLIVRLAARSGWRACMGLCSGIGHLLLLHAFASTSPAIVSPFLYSQIGFAMLLGWLFFNQVPDALSLTGMVVVTLCGLISVWLGVREKPKEPAQNRAQDKLKV